MDERGLLKLLLSQVTSSQQFHHMDVDTPLICQWLVCIGQSRQIIWWAKFGQKCHNLTVFYFSGYNFIPPGKVCFHGTFHSGARGSFT